MTRGMVLTLAFALVPAAAVAQCGYAQGNCVFPDKNGTLYVLDSTNTKVVNLLTQSVFATLPAQINAPLVLGRDGLLYGVTGGAGSSNDGTIFSLDTSGVSTVVHSFSGADGADPLTLILGDDGNLYGATYVGGASGYGTIFSFTPGTADLVSLYSFSGSLDGKAQFTTSALVQYDSSHFYGQSTTGMFSVTKSGTLIPQLTNQEFQSLTLDTDGYLYAPDFYQISSTGNVNSLEPYGFDDGNNSCDTFGGPYQIGTKGSLLIAAGCLARSPGGDETYGEIAEYSLTSGWEAVFGNQYQGPGNPENCSGPVIGYGLNGAIAGEYTCGSTVTASPSLFAAGGFSFTATPSGGAPGSTFDLAWDSQLPGPNAKECSAFGAWSGLQPSIGSTQVTLTTPGTYNYVLVCAGNFPAIATVTVTGATTTTVTASPNPVSSGNAVAVTATVLTAGGEPVTSGTVNFSVPGLGTVAVPLNASGKAVLTESSAGVPAGTYTVTAKFEGAGGYTVSSGTTSVQVVSASPTTTTFSVTTSPICVNSTVSLQALVTGSAGSPPTGSVSIEANGMEVLSMALTQGSANSSGYSSLSTNGVPAGTYQVKAVYGGDATHKPSTSSVQPLTVVPSAVVALTATPNPVPGSGTLTLTAHVTDSGAPAAGSVAFYFGSQLLGLTSLQNSVATLQQPVSGIAAGTYPVTAVYEGDTTQCKGTSAAVNVTVQ